MSYEPERSAGPSAAGIKTNLPGIFLLIVGIINVLGGVYWLYQGIQAVVAAPSVQKDTKDLTPEQKKQLEEAEKMGFNIEKIVKTMGGSLIAVGLIAMLAAAATIMAGVKMRSLQSRGLCMIGSILAMIPCISPCCLLGLPIGIWALVVLMNPEVKAAFR